MQSKHTTTRDHLRAALEKTDDTETRYHIREALQHLGAKTSVTASGTTTPQPSDD